MQKKKKTGFPMPIAKNGFLINLHPKIYIYLKKYPFLNVTLLEKFHIKNRTSSVFMLE